MSAPVQVGAYPPSCIQATQLCHHLQDECVQQGFCMEPSATSLHGRQEGCSGLKHGMEDLVDRIQTDIPIHRLVQHTA